MNFAEDLNGVHFSRLCHRGYRCAACYGIFIYTGFVVCFRALGRRLGCLVLFLEQFFLDGLEDDDRVGHVAAVEERLVQVFDSLMVHSFEIRQERLDLFPQKTLRC